MKKIAVLLLLALLAGCGKLNPLGSGDSEAKPTSYWIEQLNNKDEDKRKEAMKVLVDGAKLEVKKERKTVVEDLMDALKSPEKRIRMGAAEVLGRLGWDAEVAGDALVIALRDPEEDVARAAARALVKIDPKKAAENGVPRDINKVK